MFAPRQISSGNAARFVHRQRIRFLAFAPSTGQEVDSLTAARHGPVRIPSTMPAIPPLFPRWLSGPAILIAFLVLDVRPLCAQPAGELPDAFSGIDVIERVGERIDTTLAFTDETGRLVRLAEYFDGQTPVLLNFVYHECPMLCSIVLDALTAGLRDLAWTPGREFTVLTVSISPTETHVQAAAQKERYIERYGRPEGDRGWHFLVGDQEEITALTESVGFYYTWDADLQQYAHPAALMFLHGDGRVLRYLYGIQYPAFQLRAALIETSEGQVGSLMEKFIVSCYMYDPDAQSYTPDVMRIMRLTSGAFAVLLFFGLFFFWRREGRRRKSEPPSDPDSEAFPKRPDV